MLGYRKLMKGYNAITAGIDSKYRIMWFYFIGMNPCQIPDPGGKPMTTVMNSPENIVRIDIDKPFSAQMWCFDITKVLKKNPANGAAPREN